MGPKSPNLKTTERCLGFQKVYTRPDLSREERSILYGYRQELKRKRAINKDETWTLKKRRVMKIRSTVTPKAAENANNDEDMGGGSITLPNKL